MAKPPVKFDQNTTANNFGNELELIKVPEGALDGLRDWAAWFFRHAVTTKASSQREQARDLSLFIGFMERVEKSD